MKLISYQEERLAKVTVDARCTLRAAMAIMSEVGVRLIPITNTDGALLGVAADGDLRRYLASGGAINDPIANAMNPKPKVLNHPLEGMELQHWMRAHNIEAVPEVSEGRLVALHTLWIADAALEPAAVIMVGGLGSRLAPLTDNCPKPLLKVGDRPILSRIIQHLRSQGIRRIILSVNYLSGMIMDYYGDGSEFDVEIEYIQEHKRLGTGGALSLMDPEILSDPFLVLNGDLLSDINVELLMELHREKGWDGTMVVREHHYTIPYGVVRTCTDGAYEAAEEKPTFSYLINAGMYLLSRKLLSIVPQDKFYDLPTLFDDLRKNDLTGGVFRHNGRWIDIGNHVDFERAQNIFQSEKK